MRNALLLATAVGLIACGSSDRDPPDNQLGDMVTVVGIGEEATVTFLTADGTPIGDQATLLEAGEVKRECPPDTTVIITGTDSYATWMVTGVQPKDVLRMETGTELQGETAFQVNTTTPTPGDQVHMQVGRCTGTGFVSALSVSNSLPDNCLGPAPLDDGLFYAVVADTNRVLAAAHVDGVADGATLTWQETPSQEVVLTNLDADEAHLGWAYDVAPAASPWSGIHHGPFFLDPGQDATITVSPSPAIAPNLLVGISTSFSDGTGIYDRQYAKRHASLGATVDASELLLPHVVHPTVTFEGDRQLRIVFGNEAVRATSDAVQLSILLGDYWWYVTVPATESEIVTPAELAQFDENTQVWLRFVEVEGDGYAELRQSLGFDGLLARRQREGTFLSYRTTEVY
jgi:hypothetical protein